MNIQQANPDLWMFFENCDSYAQDKAEDLECRRWLDTLKIAEFIRITDCKKYRCTPDNMSTSYSEEYSDHNSEDGYAFYEHRAKRISKEEYEALREAYNNLSEKDRDYYVHVFTNVFHLNYRKDFLREDFLIIKPVKYDSLYLHQVAVLAQIKDIDGYYLFEFYN